MAWERRSPHASGWEWKMLFTVNDSLATNTASAAEPATATGDIQVGRNRVSHPSANNASAWATKHMNLGSVGRARAGAGS